MRLEPRGSSWRGVGAWFETRVALLTMRSVAGTSFSLQVRLEPRGSSWCGVGAWFETRFALLTMRSVAGASFSLLGGGPPSPAKAR